jgi:hypothetical protein
MKCRHCSNLLNKTFIDLGYAPPSNAYLTKSQLNQHELYYPLKVFVCNNCWLVQTEDYNNADDLFNAEYAYFSSTSTSWLKHAKDYSIQIIDQLKLNEKSFVIEVASNDGYLLKNFVAQGVPCLGIEPTKNTAEASLKLNIPVLQEFFGEKLAKKLESNNQKADLICGNNVYAHVPNINDFTLGLKIALKKEATITLEFPHLLNLIKYKQFDTIYHEHFSYLSLYTVKKIFESFGLKIFDVEELKTHGGSLRIYACHDHDKRIVTKNVYNLLKIEEQFGLTNITIYNDFQKEAINIKNNLISFLIEQYNLGKKVYAYGAAAKGNTLLNYSGIKSDLINFVFDAAESKQLMYMPGSHIPILPPEGLNSDIPDYILILPWNISDEVKNQLKHLSDRGTKFVTAIPYLQIT